RSTYRTSTATASSGGGYPCSASDGGLPAHAWGLVEDLPDLRRQHDPVERLLQQRDAGVEPALVHDRVTRIAGHEQDLELGLASMQRVRELTPIDPGHHDVGQKQVDTK